MAQARRPLGGPAHRKRSAAAGTKWRTWETGQFGAKRPRGMPRSGRGNCFAGQVGEGRRGLYAIKRQAGMVRDAHDLGDTGPHPPGMALPLDRDRSGAPARQYRQTRTPVDDVGNAQPPDYGDRPAPCRRCRNRVMPIAVGPDESHCTSVEYLAAAGAAGIMIEHQMIGPTTASAGFSAIPDRPRGRADHGDGGHARPETEVILSRFRPLFVGPGAGRFETTP
jgi:hypothetical protein